MSRLFNCSAKHVSRHWLRLLHLPRLVCVLPYISFRVSQWRREGMVGRTTQAAIRRQRRQNEGNKGDIRHLTTFWGRQNCSPPRAPITNNYLSHWNEQLLTVRAEAVSVACRYVSEQCRFHLCMFSILSSEKCDHRTKYLDSILTRISNVC